MTASSADSIAFLGLGVMGYHMAVNLRTKLPKEKTLIVSDVSDQALSRFSEQMKDIGPVLAAKNGFEAIQQADTILTVLPNDEAMKSVYLDPSSGILAGAQQVKVRTPKVAIECGTMSLEAIHEVRDAFKGIGFTLVDAPISGGPMGSQAGTLTFMVGCAEQIFPQVKTLLENMGTNIVLCGDVGTGNAFKTINNYISINSVLVASEALNIGAKLGVDLKHLINTINTSSGQSWVMSKNNPVPGIHPNAPASNGYEGGFRIELGQKDLRLGVKLADMVGARKISTGTTLKALEEAAADPRYAGKDLRVLYKWLNEQ